MRLTAVTAGGVAAASRPHVSVVRRVTLLAACTWIVLHLAHAVVFHAEHSEPVLLGTMVVLALAADAVVLAPLFGPEEAVVSPVLGYALAALSVVVAAGVQPFLTPEGLVGYANWPMGGMAVLVAALTIRRCAGGALLVVLGMSLVNGLCLWRFHRLDASIDLAWLVVQAVPGVTFLLGALGVRSLVSRSQAMTQEYRLRQLDSEAQAGATTAVKAADDERRAELRTRVLPFLDRLALDTGPLSTADHEESTRLTLALRDELRARSLLTASARDHVRAARSRHVRVTLSSDSGRAGAEDDLVLITRRVLLAVLASVPSGASVACRTTSSPPSTVLAVSGLSERQVQRASALVAEVAGAVPSARVSIDDLDAELLAHIALATDA